MYSKKFFNRIRMLREANEAAEAENKKHINLARKLSETPGEFLRLSCQWTVIVNENKKTVVMISPAGNKYVNKPMKGDEFSVVKGMAMAVFEENTGIRYQDLRKLTEMFVETTDKCDPAMNIIVRYFLESAEVTEKQIEETVNSITEEHSGKIFEIIIPIINNFKDAAIISQM